MKKNPKRYFIALIPPEPVFSKIRTLKEEIRNRFNSKAALRSPPHITLHMPFSFREDREECICQTLDDFAASQQPFRLDHHGFGAFEPRVIFVNVSLPAELSNLKNNLVRKVRQELKLNNADYKDQGFHPHMTIAFRDLKKPAFYEAWKHFEHQPFEEGWCCESLSLLKHDDRQWQQLRQFTFRTSR